MNTTKIAESYMSYKMTTEMLKSTISDSNIFDMMYQIITEKQNETMKELFLDNTTEFKETDYLNDITYENINLNTLPIMYKNINLATNINNTSTVDSNLNSIGKSETNNYSRMTVDEVLNNINQLKNNYTPAEGEELQYIKETVSKYSKMYGADEKLIYAIIKQESNFNPNAVSYAGAMGLMQIMNFNCESYDIINPLDIEQNIQGGVRIIKDYLNMYGGNVEMALMAYNGGPGTMYNRGVNSYSDIYKMPLETQNYVVKVLDYYNGNINI